MLKSIWEWIKSKFKQAAEGTAVDMVLAELGKVGEESLAAWYAKKPRSCTFFVQSFYSGIPFLQEGAAKTATPIDDKAVAEAKKDIEEFAKSKGIDLVDLDAPAQGDAVVQ